MSRRHLLLVPLLAAQFLPGGAGAQTLFDWPIRAVPQPEAILTGAGALFWNPGSLVAEVGTAQEAWVVHVDGPDATGIRGAAAAAVLDLPMELRGGIGFWHLGVGDIPRTTTSPEPQPGSLSVSEDVGFLALARALTSFSGIGGSVRVQRETVAGEAHVKLRGDLGVHLRTELPLSPRFGLGFRGFGGDMSTLAGVEGSLPPLAEGRIPLSIGYGLEKGWAEQPTGQRFSLRGSWMDQLRLGVGLNHVNGEGWTPLWMVGVEIGRYSLAILRESLLNNFGAAHYFRAAIRFQ